MGKIMTIEDISRLKEYAYKLHDWHCPRSDVKVAGFEDHPWFPKGPLTPSDASVIESTECVSLGNLVLDMLEEYAEVQGLLKGDPEIIRMVYERRELELDMKHWSAAILAYGFKKSLADAKNFVAIRMHSGDVMMEITIKRIMRQSPMDQLKIAKELLTVEQMDRFKELTGNKEPE